MQMKKIIDQAKDQTGKSLGQLAADMNVKQSAITAWKKGDYRPGPSQIIYLAECAKIPALETLAEIESEAHPEMANFWKRAVSELRQNQGLSRWNLTQIKAPYGAFIIGSARDRGPACFHRRAGDRVSSF